MGYGQLCNSPSMNVVKRRCMPPVLWSMRNMSVPTEYSWKSGADVAAAWLASGTPRNLSHGAQFSLECNPHRPVHVSIVNGAGFLAMKIRNEHASIVSYFALFGQVSFTTSKPAARIALATSSSKYSSKYGSLLVAMRSTKFPIEFSFKICAGLRSKYASTPPGTRTLAASTNNASLVVRGISCVTSLMVTSSTLPSPNPHEARSSASP
mmetsp:Transcript_5432/g.15207  ORF Transcript_5432/g.15207 Transcript_5432/m.15207 type:complete len:209 (+) Transcript_5432:388-1014(+)